MHQFLCLRFILQQHVGFVRTLDTQQLVVGYLIGTDNKVHLAVVHVQPSDGTLIVIVCLESFSLGQEIFPDAWFDGYFCRHVQEVGDLVDMLFIFIVVPDSFKGTVCSSADKCIRAVLVWIVPCFEFLHGHVGRIETCTCRAVTISFYERFTAGAVPRTVIDFSEGLLERIRDSVEQSLLVTEILFPIDGIHFVCSETIKVEHFLPIVGDSAQVRCIEGYQCIVVDPSGERRLRGLVARNHQREKQDGKD